MKRSRRADSRDSQGGRGIGEHPERVCAAQHHGADLLPVAPQAGRPGGLGGAEIIQKLLKIHPAIKAIASSGYSTDKMIVDYQTYGFVDILVKPYKVNELDNVIQKSLQK